MHLDCTVFNRFNCMTCIRLSSCARSCEAIAKSIRNHNGSNLSLQRVVFRVAVFQIPQTSLFPELKEKYKKAKLNIYSDGSHVVCLNIINITCFYDNLATN